MERTEAPEIFNAEHPAFLCIPSAPWSQLTWSGILMMIWSMYSYRLLHFLLILQWRLPGCFSLISSAFVGSNHHPPEPSVGIGRPLCYPSMVWVKASFWQECRSCCFLFLFVAWLVLTRSYSMATYTGVCSCLRWVLALHLSKHFFLLLHSQHGRGCRSWL